MIHLDTTFLVDLLREQRRDRFGPASSYLEQLPDNEVLGVSVHVVCELMAGAHAPGAPSGEVERLARLCEALVVHYPDERFAPQYGRLLAHIQASGASIAAMDLLIADGRGDRRGAARHAQPAPLLESDRASAREVHRRGGVRAARRLVYWPAR